MMNGLVLAGVFLILLMLVRKPWLALYLLVTVLLSYYATLGMTTLSIRNTGGTDHLSYDAVGLPGFQFIQDEIDYNARTHHSNMDTYERLQPNDMMRNAVIVASFVLNAANRDEKLPRKPLPKPTPPAAPAQGRGTPAP